MMADQSLPVVPSLVEQREQIDQLYAGTRKHYLRDLRIPGLVGIFMSLLVFLVYWFATDDSSLEITADDSSLDNLRQSLELSKRILEFILIIFTGLVSTFGAYALVELKNKKDNAEGVDWFISKAVENACKRADKQREELGVFPIYGQLIASHLESVWPFTEAYAKIVAKVHKERGGMVWTPCYIVYVTTVRSGSHLPNRRGERLRQSESISAKSS